MMSDRNMKALNLPLILTINLLFLMIKARIKRKVQKRNQVLLNKYKEMLIHKPKIPKALNN